MDINQRVRSLRKDFLHMTQEDFASSIKMSRSNLGSIEIGRIAVTDRVILDICEKFNVNVEWLRSGKGDVFVPKTRNQTITDFFGDVIKDDDSFKKRFIEALAALDIEDWEYLEKIVMKLTKKD